MIAHLQHFWLLFVIVLFCSLPLRSRGEQQVITIAGNTTAGFVNAVGRLAQFNWPRAVCVDPITSDLYISDLNNNYIRKIAVNISVSSVLAVSAPFSMRVDRRASARRLYVASSSCVLTIHLGNLSSYTLAGNCGSSGYVPGTGSVARLKVVTGMDIPITDAEKLYCADQNNYIIRYIFVDNGTVVNFAGKPTNRSSSDGNRLTMATFSKPCGLSWNTNATVLYVMDTDIGVRKIQNDVVTTILTNVVGVLVGARDVSFHPLTGELFIANRDKHVVTVMYPNYTAKVFAGDVNNVSAFDGPISQATFTNPVSLTVAQNGTLYVTDSGANMVRSICCLPKTPPSIYYGPYGYDNTTDTHSISPPPTFTPSDTCTPSASLSLTLAVSSTISVQPSVTLSLLSTLSLSGIVTSTISKSLSTIVSITNSLVATPTFTATNSRSNTVPSLSDTLSVIPSSTDTLLPTPSLTATYSFTSSQTLALTPSITLTNSLPLTLTISLLPSASETVLPTKTWAFTQTRTVSASRGSQTSTPTLTMSKNTKTKSALTPSFSATNDYVRLVPLNTSVDAERLIPTFTKDWLHYKKNKGSAVLVYFEVHGDTFDMVASHATNQSNLGQYCQSFLSINNTKGFEEFETNVTLQVFSSYLAAIVLPFNKQLGDVKQNRVIVVTIKKPCFSKRWETVSFNFTLVAYIEPEPVPKEVVKAAETAAETGTMVGGLTGSPTMAVQASRLNNLLTITDCEAEFDEQLSFTQNPIQAGIRISDNEAIGFYLAVIVFNPIILLSFAGLQLLIAKLLTCWKKDMTWKKAKALVRFPSLLAFPLLLLIEPTAMSATMVLIFGTITTRVMAIFSVIALTASLILLGRVLLKPHLFAAVYDPHGKAGEGRIWEFLEGKGKWRPDVEEPDFLCAWRLWFMDFTDRNKWFIFVDIIFSFFSGVIDGIKLGKGQCNWAAFVMFFMYLGLWMLMVYKRPFIAPFDQWFMLLIASLQLVASGLNCIYVFGSNKDKKDETDLRILMVMTYCVMIAMYSLIVKAGIDIIKALDALKKAIQRNFLKKNKKGGGKDASKNNFSFLEVPLLTEQEMTSIQVEGEKNNNTNGEDLDLELPEWEDDVLLLPEFAQGDEVEEKNDPKNNPNWYVDPNWNELDDHRGPREKLTMDIFVDGDEEDDPSKKRQKKLETEEDRAKLRNQLKMFGSTKPQAVILTEATSEPTPSAAAKKKAEDQKKKSQSTLAGVNLEFDSDLDLDLEEEEPLKPPHDDENEAEKKKANIQNVLGAVLKPAPPAKGGGPDLSKFMKRNEAELKRMEDDDDDDDDEQQDFEEGERYDEEEEDNDNDNEGWQEVGEECNPTTQEDEDSEKEGGEASEPNRSFSHPPVIIEMDNSEKKKKNKKAKDQKDGKKKKRQQKKTKEEDEDEKKKKKKKAQF